MAIGLNDLKNKKAKKQEPNKILQKDKKLTRPWESFDPFQDQVSTTRSLEAMLKAKEKSIKESNQKFTSEFDEFLSSNQLNLASEYHNNYQGSPSSILKFIINLFK